MGCSYRKTLRSSFLFILCVRAERKPFMCYKVRALLSLHFSAVWRDLPTNHMSSSVNDEAEPNRPRKLHFPRALL